MNGTLTILINAILGLILTAAHIILQIVERVTAELNLLIVLIGTIVLVWG